MRIVRVELENYRCLRKVGFSCEPLTALIGANGSGKSTTLKALEFFFRGQSLDDLDWWGENTDQQVRVTVVFAELAATHADRLCPWLDDAGQLRLTRVAAPDANGRRAVWFESVRRQVPEFQKIRQIEAATPLRAAFNQLRSDPRFGDLPTVRSQAEARQAMDRWEEQHPELCQPLADHTLMIGGGGEFDLAGMFEFVLVPAVRDAAQDAVEGRSGGFRQLVELLVRTRLDIDEKLEALRGEIEIRYGELLAADGDAILSETSALLSDRLAALAPGAAVRLHWAPRAVTLDPPKVYAEIVEGGFAAEVGRQGHGVQRAYLMTLLQVLAGAHMTADEAAERPLLILALEEPELYQHPVRARYLAGVLHRLAYGADGAATQVFYTTHSPLFVSVDRVRSLRLLRITGGAEGVPETSLTSVDLDAAAVELWEAHGGDGERWTASSLQPRLRPLVETPVSEGFFADLVVLLEGEEDRAVLAAAAAQRGVDLCERGIALLPVGGKENLDRAIVLFRQFGIPAYVLFDADRCVGARERAHKARSNRALLRLLRQPVEDFPDTRVTSSFACFENTLWDTVRGELGAQAVGQAISRACVNYGFPTDRARNKNSVVLCEALRELALQGATSAMLTQVMDQIESLTGPVPESGVHQ